MFILHIKLKDLDVIVEVFVLVVIRYTRNSTSKGVRVLNPLKQNFQLNVRELKSGALGLRLFFTLHILRNLSVACRLYERGCRGVRMLQAGYDVYVRQ